MIRDIVTRDNYAVPPLLGPSDITNHTTVASKILNTQGARGAAVVVFTGAVSGDDGSTNTCTVHLQESDTTADADFADVSMLQVVRYSQTQADDSQADQALAGAAEAGIAAWPLLVANCVVRLGYLGVKQYIRAKLVFAGTGIDHLNQVVLGKLQYQEIIPHKDISPVTAT